MWEGGNSVIHKERSNFSLHLLFSFWYNFEDQMMFCSVFVKETLGIIQFFNAAKLLITE